MNVWDLFHAIGEKPLHESTGEAHITFFASALPNSEGFIHNVKIQIIIINNLQTHSVQSSTLSLSDTPDTHRARAMAHPLISLCLWSKVHLV